MQRLIEELQDRGYHSVERFERLCTMAHSSDPKNELSITIHDSDASVTHEMIGEVSVAWSPGQSALGAYANA